MPSAAIPWHRRDSSGGGRREGERMEGEGRVGLPGCHIFPLSPGVLWLRLMILWGIFTARARDGQLQFTSRAVSSLPKVCACVCVC